MHYFSSVVLRFQTFYDFPVVFLLLGLAIAWLAEAWGQTLKGDSADRRTLSVPNRNDIAY